MGSWCDDVSSCCGCLTLRAGVVLCSFLAIIFNLVSPLMTFIVEGELGWLPIIVSAVCILFSAAGLWGAIALENSLLMIYMVYSIFASMFYLLSTLFLLVNGSGFPALCAAINAAVYISLIAAIGGLSSVINEGGTGDKRKSAKKLRAIRKRRLQAAGDTISPGVPYPEAGATHADYYALAGGPAGPGPHLHQQQLASHPQGPQPDP